MGPLWWPALQQLPPDRQPMGEAKFLTYIQSQVLQLYFQQVVLIVKQIQATQATAESESLV